MDPPQKPADLDLNCSLFIKEDTSELSFEPVNYMLLKQDIIVSNKIGLRLGLRMDFLLCPILRPNILCHILFK